MEKVCPPLEEVLKIAWEGYVFQRTINKERLIEVLVDCPPEYLEKTARIFGITWAIVQANAEPESCYPNLTLGLVLLGLLSKDLGLDEMPERLMKDIEAHILVCSSCEAKFLEIERLAKQRTEDFKKNPRICLE